MSIKLASQQTINSTNSPQLLSILGAIGPAVITTPSLAASATYTSASAGLVGVYTFTATSSLVVAKGGLVDILATGSGGGGGQGDNNTIGGGGGGAGGYMFLENFYLPAGSYTVTIGAGGAKASGQGNPTYINNLLMVPGGGGGGRAGSTRGRDGGSGGGGGANAQVKGSTVLLSTGNIRGNDGGAHAEGVNYSGGGGGGAGAAGTAAGTNAGGAGGIGIINNIVDGSTNTYYCGGGGGAAVTSQGAGGLGGGGTGNSLTVVDGTANTGGGGGGGYTSAARTGNGGSGYLVIRVRI